MTPQTKLFTFALPEDLKAALPEIKVRDGISEVEQIRRGIRLWIERVALSRERRSASASHRASALRLSARPVDCATTRSDAKRRRG
jgi:hypothetical protein